MNTAILYTVLSLANLIGYTVGVGLLPARVPIHFTAAMTADVLGSPWVFLALPGAAALISGGIWATFYQKKNRAVTVGILSALGIALSTVGWAFFALAASGVEIGGKASFPVCLVTVFPLSLLFVWLGCLMTNKDAVRLPIRPSATRDKAVWERTVRFGGILLAGAGLMSAVSAVPIGICVPPSLQFLSAVTAAVCVLLAAGGSLLYARVLARKSGGF